MVTAQFSGIVQYASPIFTGGVGSTFTGSYSYDTGAAVTALPGVFQGLGIGYAMLSFVIDGQSYGPAVLGIADNYGGADTLWVTTSSPLGFPAIQLQGPSSLWSGTDLSVLNGRTLTDFISSNTNIVSSDGGNQGRITAWSQFTASTVPEPSTLALAALALAVCTRRRPRQRATGA